MKAAYKSQRQQLKGGDESFRNLSKWKPTDQDISHTLCPFEAMAALRKILTQKTRFRSKSHNTLQSNVRLTREEAKGV